MNDENYSEYGNQVDTVLLLWDNTDDDTKCQAMCCVGDESTIAKIAAQLAAREPAEDAEFLANLARHREETYMRECRA